MTKPDSSPLAGPFKEGTGPQPKTADVEDLELTIKELEQRLDRAERKAAYARLGQPARRPDADPNEGWVWRKWVCHYCTNGNWRLQPPSRPPECSYCGRKASPYDKKENPYGFKEAAEPKEREGLSAKKRRTEPAANPAFGEFDADGDPDGE